MSVQCAIISHCVIQDISEMEEEELAELQAAVDQSGVCIPPQRVGSHCPGHSIDLFLLMYFSTIYNNMKCLRFH